ncbi:uncharacterized conserved protein [Sanguibacter keddieii DSM 10542]|uniref:Uncharacterized conserved protein n=1 Tax=Sanguibacter keddieii (strain ATCC 51767 / DSM 10542 / NCFB 3025 / ST-74) TaxID=446469 RepID=D1BHY0_SANKS|nr:DUF2264 domain-containing protein [Sanguibacter keddieii]ACZ22050.1 uncharacterized conserved protein [Sanguibacter keddieii DSM 10542]
MSRPGVPGRGTLLGRVPADHALSPCTGWTRAHWAALADDLLLSTRPFTSPDGSHVDLPGRTGGYGRDVDGLEGFARTFMLAAFRLAGERGHDPLDLAGRYAAGFAAGTDPTSPRRWTRPDEHGQAKVEAAALAIGLDMTRPWIWDRMSPTVQQQVVDYLATVVGGEYPQTNWVWFRIVVETFLRSVGGPYSSEDVESDLAAHDTFVREGGWYADGPERSFDHYTGWALHLYPVLWARMAPDDPLVVARRPRLDAHLDDYLRQAVALVGADGAPLFQGRSLVYRFAAAAPFWAGALAGSSVLTPGQVRRAASGVVRHFTEHGVPDERGLLTLGWHGAWPDLAQHYSGTGSPYWASKGLLGLALPADHPVWTAVEELLPVERGDVLAVAPAPGWLVSGTRDDGIVRVVNHGTDHALPGDDVSDSPLYARLGYSTVTSPVMGRRGWTDPVDQSVALVGPDGRLSHRSGFEALSAGTVRLEGGAGTAPSTADTVGTVAAVGFSRGRAHWVHPAGEVLDYGSGHRGDVTWGPWVTTGSVVRGAWEVRLVRVAPAEGATSGRLRVAGWAVSGDRAPVPVVDGASTLVSARASTPTLVSSVRAAVGELVPGVDVEHDATALGACTAVPWLTTAGEPGEDWYAVVVRLAGATVDPGPTPRVRVEEDVVHVTWGDGLRCRAELPGDGARGDRLDG